MEKFKTKRRKWFKFCYGDYAKMRGVTTYAAKKAKSRGTFNPNNLESVVNWVTKGKKSIH